MTRNRAAVSIVRSGPARTYADPRYCPRTAAAAWSLLTLKVISPSRAGTMPGGVFGPMLSPAGTAPLAGAAALVYICCEPSGLAGVWGAPWDFYGMNHDKPSTIIYPLVISPSTAEVDASVAAAPKRRSSKRNEVPDFTLPRLKPTQEFTQKMAGNQQELVS